MLDSKFLEGQVALVTGAGKGIGRAIAEALARAGARVGLGDIEWEAVEEVAAQIRQAGGEALPLALDVTIKEACSKAVESLVNEYGRLDIVVNNAGVSTMNWVKDMSEEEWDFNFKVNAKGVFLVSQAALPQMIKRKQGKIINIASMAGKRGVPLLAHYAASKWAVIGFTKSLALEVAKYGITCNAVCPGYVRTSMQERELVWEARLRGMTVEEVKAEYIRNTPLGRLEEPEDVAKVVLFLASPAADFITGEAIDVTGGADLI
ncbi:3-hydroxybutyrate dehydrogenase [Thermanaeromonas toyohensis ToBE]|uniref:3-hydroxybutyrate dehydrogenase n=1 Tax=Thermanaeromonas toyohensis ToBE TaxID=698762 RepID=A0A1W1VXT7_9FIRM|nr:SDR family NAD(P)-dependent oxidoreductase [Thermanaeromonas toyohensis]SMB98187.1 3-hydroxybutyrate dehydrogenase [Thermanaeromonas toyohensis ToBE]